MSQNLVTKLGLKAMKAQPKKNSMGTEEKPESPRAIATMYGRANKYEVGQSNFGEFTKFRGSFEGVNVETGEVYKSGSCFLPKVAEELLVAALDNSGDSAVDFALEIGVQYSDNAVGYEYTVKPLTAPAEADELSSLRALAQKALPAPEKAQDTTAETKTTTTKGKK